jgi:hypothetical protein
MLGRRLLVLMAVLLGLTALAAALAPRPTVVPPGGRLIAPTPTTTPTPTPSASARPGPPSQEVVRTIDASEGARFARVRARVGDTVRLTVRGDVLDAVEIDGIDQIEPVEAGSPARFEFFADERGQFPIVLIDGDRRIGQLDVRPAD